MGRLPNGGMGGAGLHAAACCGGTGVFLLGNSSVLLLRGEYAAVYGSPYVDAHGETDVGLKRGKPLTLSGKRYAGLAALWAKPGGVARAVSAAILVSDRRFPMGWF